MNEHDLGRLFDPFSGVAGESALGLSVAWGVMSRIGGSLSAASKPGEGTTFTLTFPLAAPPRRPPAPVEKPAPRRRRILIIDDEIDNLEVLREVLELEGQETHTARSGPEALAQLHRGERFDIILCDVGMPEMSGWQVAREIQRLAAGTPVWMITGWANEIAEGDPRRQFVRGVLPKPLDMEQLRAMIAAPRSALAADAAEAVHP
jgi:CheY-like chemotaxis protein